MGPWGAGNVLFSSWYRCVHYAKLNCLLRICTFDSYTTHKKY